MYEGQAELKKGIGFFTKEVSAGRHLNGCTDKELRKRAKVVVPKALQDKDIKTKNPITGASIKRSVKLL